MMISQEQILAHITPPSFPAHTVSILEFGAQADRQAPQTACIQAAIDQVSRDGGGTVLVPAGTFLTGALQLKSGVNLHLQSPDSLLRFTTQLSEEHYPLVYSHWEATPCYNYSALIYANGAQDIALTGAGVLDAAADHSNWWGWHHQVENAWSKDAADLQSPARMALRQMNADGVPIEERRFGDGHFLRPNFFQTIDCTRVLIEGVTFLNSPMWQLNPVRCHSVIVRGVTLRAHGPNSDGCDPESCNGVLIEDCRFETGDDCISLKSGRDRDGRDAPPCENIVIRKNLFADGHGGIAFGSEMSGGIRNVFAQYNRFESPNLTYVLRFKTNAKRGGFVEQVCLLDTEVTAVSGAAIHATMMYEDGPYGEHLPRFEHICVERLNACGGDYGIFLEAFPEVPIRGLELRDITIRDVGIPLRAMNWDAPVIAHVNINGEDYPRPTQVRVQNVPCANHTVVAQAQYLGGEAQTLTYRWMLNDALLSTEAQALLPSESAGAQLKLMAYAPNGACTESRSYLVQPEQAPRFARLASLELHAGGTCAQAAQPITRMELARLLAPLCPPAASAQFEDVTDPSDAQAAAATVQAQVLACQGDRFAPDAFISRQELATVAMQCCGVSYRNASSTMPRCADVSEVSVAYGTNVARSLYFGFLTCDAEQAFHPKRHVTWEEALETVTRVVEFAQL